MTVTALSLLALSFIITALVVPWARRRALKFGFVDLPDERKIHQQPMPRGGGIAIVAGVMVPVLVGIIIALFVRLLGPMPFLPEIINEEAPRIVAALPQLLTILAGGLVIASLGLLDDYRGLPPTVKLLVEAGVALVLVLQGIHVTVFIHSRVVCAIITIGWIVGITNAFNFLDNMDGLCSGVAVTISAVLLIVAIQTKQYFVAAMLLVIIGSASGFLCYNFPPASIFMGDTGSLFLGYMLSTCAVVFTFYREGYRLFPVAVPLIAFSVPLFDTVTVIGIRVRDGKPLMKADMNHFSHRLVRLGMTPKCAVLFIYLVTFATGLMATLLYQTTNTGAAIILIEILIVLLIIGILEATARSS